MWCSLLSPAALAYRTGLLTKEASAVHSTPVAIADRTTIGSLNVPHIGIGTIAWTEELEKDSIADAALDAGVDMFDTAERYGAKPASLIPAALASLGLPVSQDYLGGDTESYLGSQLSDATILTKFAPTPWRGDAQSIVAACRGSAERLNRDSVDLMQVHMVSLLALLQIDCTHLFLPVLASYMDHLFGSLTSFSHSRPSV